MSDAPEVVLDRVIEELVNGGRIERLEELVGEDIVSHDPAEPAPIIGREAYRETIQATRSALADLHVRIDDRLVDGDKIAYRWTATARHVGELHGIPPTGNQVELTGIDIARIQDGLIVEEWTNWDAPSLFQQLGGAPTRA